MLNEVTYLSIQDDLRNIREAAQRVMAASRGIKESGKVPGAMSNILAQCHDAEEAAAAWRRGERKKDKLDEAAEEMAEEACQAAQGRLIRDAPASMHEQGRMMPTAEELSRMVTK